MTALTFQKHLIWSAADLAEMKGCLEDDQAVKASETHAVVHIRHTHADVIISKSLGQIATYVHFNQW